MGFKVTGHKGSLINVVSDSTLKLSLKKLPFNKFWCAPNKSICNYPKRLLKYFLFYLCPCVKLHFLYVLQTQQTITKD